MTVRTLAQEQKAQLIAREQAIAHQIDAAYSGMWQTLAHKLLRLLDEMQQAEQAAKARGEPFHALLWVRQIRRLDTLLASVQGDMYSFVQAALQLVRGGLPWAAYHGQQDAQALLEASFNNRIGIAFGKPSAQALHELAQRTISFKGMTDDAVIVVRKRLLAGLALGENPRAVARAIESGMRGVSRSRALTIARTEMVSSYRSAALLNYRANSDVVRGWIWSAAPDACDFCLRMNGSRHDLSETLESHPNCRCAPIPETISYDDVFAQLIA